MREKVLVNIFKITCIVVFAGLSYYSLVQTGYSSLNLADEAVYFKRDNVFLNILSVAIVFAILLALKYLTDKYEVKLNTRILAVGAAFLTRAVGFLCLRCHISTIHPEKAHCHSQKGRTDSQNSCI